MCARLGHDLLRSQRLAPTTASQGWPAFEAEDEGFRREGAGTGRSRAKRASLGEGSACRQDCLFEGRQIVARLAGPGDAS
jgi:hypothetical protein